MSTSMYYKNDRGIVLRIDGVPHHHHGYLSGRHDIRNAVTGMPYVAKDDAGVVGLLTDRGFDDLLDSETLVIESVRSPDRVRLLNDASELSVAQALEFDPNAARMLAQVQLLDDAHVPNGVKAIETFLDRDGRWTPELLAKWGAHDKPRTIKEWRAKRGSAGHRHARQMIRLNGKLARSRWSDVEEQSAEKHALASKTNGVAPSDAHAAHEEEIDEINEGRHPVHPAPDRPYRAMSLRSFHRRIRRLLCDATEAASPTKGRELVEQDWRGAGAPLTADHVMQRVIIDHTRMDVFVVDDEREMVLGRPWLTLAIDVRTRAIVAHLITFHDPSIWTVGQILRRMAAPKRPPAWHLERWPVLRRLRGRPDQIIVDNAVEFRSLFFEAAARGLGFSIRYCPVKKPRYRAIIERGIGTANAGICHAMRGRVLPIAEARRLGYDGEKQAVVIMDELEAIANWWVAEYNVTGHEGIRNQAPAAYFEKEAARTGVMNFRDMRRFRIETLDVIPQAELDAGGLTRWGLRFHHVTRVPELLNDLVRHEPGRRRRKRAACTVMFRYDPMDLGSIWVWNRASQDYVELHCADEAYRGLPLFLHLDMRKAAKAEGRLFATSQQRREMRARRIAAVRAIDPQAAKERRAEIARLYEIPRIRAITGNIVDLELHPRPGDLESFITADPASYTALDMQILAPRKGLADGGTPADPFAEAEEGDVATSSGRRGRLTRGGLQ